MKNKSTSVLRSVLGGRVVTYHPVFARALKSVPAAVMLSQAYFWQESAHYKEIKTIDGREFFSKTAVEWYESTGVTDEQQATARAILRNSGFWFEKRTGTPAKLYFHVDIDRLISVISRFLKTGIPVSGSAGKSKPGLPGCNSGTSGNLDSGNSGIPIIVESLESLESDERGRARAENQPSFEKKEKEKAPPIPGAPPAGPGPGRPAATTFAESIWATATTGSFAQALHDYAPETADADAGYYRNRCRDWSAQNPGKLKPDWIAFAAQIIGDDRGRGKLVTIQPIQTVQNGIRSQHHAPGSAGEPLIDIESVRRRAAAMSERWKAKNPGRYKQ